MPPDRSGWGDAESSGRLPFLAGCLLTVGVLGLSLLAIGS